MATKKSSSKRKPKLQTFDKAEQLANKELQSTLKKQTASEKAFHKASSAYEKLIVKSEVKHVPAAAKRQAVQKLKSAEKELGKAVKATESSKNKLKEIAASRRKLAAYKMEMEEQLAHKLKKEESRLAILALKDRRKVSTK